MRVLVTGGAGFIGSHLCERLLQSGYDVVCLDNLFTGRRDNVAGLIGHPGFDLIRHDVVDPILLQVDRIYNLACPASPVHYQYDPIKTIKTNVDGTLNILTLARRVGARVLQASTSEVYGDPAVHPQVEGYWGNVNPIGPRACYDEGKRVAETLMMEHRRQYGVDTRIVRIFNTYGPRMSEHDGRVVSNFIVQALRGEPLTIYGEGQQTRSFCYVDDLVTGLIRLMELEDDGRAAVHEPVNLGNPGEFTMLELATEVCRLVGRKGRVVHQPLPQDDPTQRKPDITRARTLLGWEPVVPLRVGLKRTIAYFRDRLARGADLDRRRPAAIAAEAAAATGKGNGNGHANGSSNGQANGNGRARGRTPVLGDRRAPVQTTTWLEQSLG